MPFKKKKLIPKSPFHNDYKTIHRADQGAAASVI